jgi:hypothetical protein
MTLIVSDLGSQYTAAVLKAAWINAFQVGLYSNDWTPYRGMRLSMVTPASFSGYVGLRTINTFSSLTWDGTRATLTGPLMRWVHDGGPIQGLVFGYYVVNTAGDLVWAERIDPPTWLIEAGEAYRVTPRFTVRSEFG